MSAKLLESLEFAMAMGFDRLHQGGFFEPPYARTEWKEEVHNPTTNFSKKYTNITVDSLITRDPTHLSFSNVNPRLHPFALHYTLFGDLEVVERSHLKVWLQVFNRADYEIKLLARKYNVFYRSDEHQDPAVLLEVYGELMDEMELDDVECFQERIKILV